MITSMFTSSLSSQCEEDLHAWVLRVRKRFPTWSDTRLIKGFHTLLGMGASTSFLEERKLPHLKRLLVTQFLLQKKIEKTYGQQKDQFLIRIFSVDSTLCIAAFYPKQDNTLTDQTILKVASQNVPALAKIASSYYQWDDRTLPYTFCYVELEKMRGKKLAVAEVKGLEKYLKAELPHYLIAPSVFWPYNHEEAFKQLLILAKEISSKKDYPQVSIHFQKQTLADLEFIIYLARPKGKSYKAITERSFPSSVHWVAHIKQEIEAHIPTLIEAFSICIPIENYKNRSEVNLLHAREFIAKLLERAIGVFRDYNGGLFEMQKTRFEELSRLFSENIPNFSLFADDLFYALMPIEAQMSLDDFLFEKLFEGFSQTLSKSASFLNQPNSHIAIFKSQDPDELTGYLRQAKKLQEKRKVMAYASVKVLAEHYLCLISHKEDLTGKIKQRQQSHAKMKTLRLDFEVEDAPSLSYPYIVKEIRSRILAYFLFEGLFRKDPNHRVLHAGCMSMTISNHGKRYLFKLRNADWSNGERVTAFHYEEAWRKNFLAEFDLSLFDVFKNAVSIKNNKKDIQSLGVKALDERHLQVDLDRKDPLFLERLAHPCFFPYQREFIEFKDFNGPYYILEKKAQQLVLEKNPCYWDAKSIFFDKVAISFGCFPSQMHQSFQNRQTAWIGTPFSFATSPLLRKKKEISSPFLLYFNTGYFPLSSPLIRRALSDVIDRHLISSEFFKSRPLFSFSSSRLSPPPLCDKGNLAEAVDLFEAGLKNLG